MQSTQNTAPLLLLLRQLGTLREYQSKRMAKDCLDQGTVVGGSLQLLIDTTWQLLTGFQCERATPVRLA